MMLGKIANLQLLEEDPIKSICEWNTQQSPKSGSEMLKMAGLKKTLKMRIEENVYKSVNKWVVLGI